MISTDIPLIDLHRHLDGSVRLQTILELAQEHDISLPAVNIDQLRPYVQVVDPQPGVMAFIEKFTLPLEVMVDYDAIRRIAYENVEDLWNEGIDYAELRFSPLFMSLAHRLDPVGVVEAVIDGITAGCQSFGIPVHLIGILSRTYGQDAAAKELAALLAHKRNITALDLAGDEANFPAELFTDHFRIARNAGCHITVHAGESAGPESIWVALRKLGAERIGHALRATEDPVLMEYLAKYQIGVESCLTSNVQTSCVNGYESHPLKQFLAKGIPASINTDDPGISGITLPFEYESAAPRAGLTAAQIRQAQNNAFSTAFLSAQEKVEFLKKTDRTIMKVPLPG